MKITFTCRKTLKGCVVTMTTPKRVVTKRFLDGGATNALYRAREWVEREIEVLRDTAKNLQKPLPVIEVDDELKTPIKWNVTFPCEREVRLAMQRANQIAVNWYHEYVGVEHVLLALLTLEKEAVLGDFFQTFGVSVDDVIDAVGTQMTTGPECILLGRLPYTPNLRKVLEAADAARAARAAESITLLDLRAAMLRVDNNIAYKVLTEMGFYAKHGKELGDFSIHRKKPDEVSEPSPAEIADAPPRYIVRAAWRTQLPELPEVKDNPEGLHRRYLVTSLDGKTDDTNPIYFVLRLDNRGDDPLHSEACRAAAEAYCRTIFENPEATHLRQTACDLEKLITTIRQQVRNL